MKTSRQDYHMIDASGPCGTFALTENEAEKLRSKGWEVTQPECAPDTVLIKISDPEPIVRKKVTEHYHLVDSKGAYQGQRMLGQAEANAMRELGWHLVHVGDASKDPDEVRAIKNITKN